MFVLAAAAPFAPADQEYLFEARQMQALSFAVHIPLVCFRIAFPAFVLFMEAHWLRTGDPVYRTVAKRWSKVMLAREQPTKLAALRATKTAEASRGQHGRGEHRSPRDGVRGVLGARIDVRTA